MGGEGAAVRVGERGGGGGGGEEGAGGGFVDGGGGGGGVGGEGVAVAGESVVGRGAVGWGGWSGVGWGGDWGDAGGFGRSLGVAVGGLFDGIEHKVGGGFVWGVLAWSVENVILRTSTVFYPIHSRHPNPHHDA